MRYIATIADKVGGVFFSFWCSGAQCQDLFVYFICHSRALTLFCFFLGAVEEVPPVHGDHRQSQRPAGSWGQQERKHPPEGAGLGEGNVKKNIVTLKVKRLWIYGMNLSCCFFFGVLLSHERRARSRPWLPSGRSARRNARRRRRSRRESKRKRRDRKSRRTRPKCRSRRRIQLKVCLLWVF